jgi:hypothetical protein
MWTRSRPVATCRCSTPGTVGIGRLAGGWTASGSRLARWWMVIGPPFLVLVVTRQGAAARRKVPSDFAPQTGGRPAGDLRSASRQDGVTAANSDTNRISTINICDIDGYI